MGFSWHYRFTHHHQRLRCLLGHTGPDKAQLCFKAHVLFRAGELDYTAVADLSLLQAKPGPRFVPLCSSPQCHLTQDLLSSSTAQSLCRFAPTSRVATLQGCFNCKTITKPREFGCMSVQTELAPSGGLGRSCDSPSPALSRIMSQKRAACHDFKLELLPHVLQPTGSFSVPAVTRLGQVLQPLGLFPH